MTDDMRERIRRALAEADGFDYDHLEPHDYQRHADAILALLQAETGREVRAVQGWMALDLHTALGKSIDHTAPHQGHGSWADWWATLCAEVRSWPPFADCGHAAEFHGPEVGCVECRCTSTVGHE